MVYIKVTVVRFIYLLKEILRKCPLGRPKNNGKIKINLRYIASDVAKLMGTALKLFQFPQNS
jgi:hypothetical protein